ncbi:hypothetical protein PTI98_013512 [Pleurotus ostreatus]|nr:hypothetical protein PTI98_013512 [Pleurotus ostreatus]
MLLTNVNAKGSAEKIREKSSIPISGTIEAALAEIKSCCTVYKEWLRLVFLRRALGRVPFRWTIWYLPVDLSSWLYAV